MKLLLPLSIHCSCDQAYVDLTSNAMSCCGRGFTVLSEEPFNWWVQMAGLGEQSLPQVCAVANHFELGEHSLPQGCAEPAT